MPGQIVFICGCGHSGTSLAAAMFAAHPEFYMPRKETGVFTKSALAKERWAALRQRWQSSGRPHLSEKTPRHIRYLPRIRDHVPEARFLVMVRDGRDVASSHIKRYGSAEPGMERWVRDNEFVLSERDHPDVHVIRYEDLVVDPEGILRQATAFAGVPFDSAMLRYFEQPQLWFGVKEKRPGSGEDGKEHNLLRNWQINQPIFDGRNQWIGKLTDEQVAFFNEGRAGEIMRLFGYDTEAHIATTKVPAHSDVRPKIGGQ